MPIDLSGNIDRWEANDLRMFTYIDTQSVPSTLNFTVFGTNGNTLTAPTVVVSGSDVTKGMFYVFNQMPSSRGFYTYQWRAYGSGTVQQSLYVTVRGTFEIIKTEPVSFLSYGAKGNVLRVARQLIGRGDLTEHDVQPHMEAAYGYINARLGGVTTVPLTAPAPPYIAQGEEVIAVYTLYGLFGGTEKGEIPPSYAKLRNDFVGFLDAVVKGGATVDGTIDGVTASDRDVTAFNGGIEGGKPTFGRQPWENQIVDTDIIDFEEQDD